MLPDYPIFRVTQAGKFATISKRDVCVGGENGWRAVLKQVE
jgi:hypothetical protein